MDVGGYREAAAGAPKLWQGRRVGSLAGQIAVPDDSDRMGAPEIEQLFADSAQSAHAAVVTDRAAF
jgi:hypothetical protein